jgi:non-ribosomal peptide synthetase-like protein
LGDGAQLGHASALHARQAVPDGEHWHGSPAQRTEVDYSAVEPMQVSTLRRAAYSLLQLLSLLVLRLPLTLVGVALLVAAVPQLDGLLDSGSPDFTSWTFFRDALIVSLVFLLGSGLVGLLFVVTVPRVLNRAIQPDRVYPLFGFHFWVQREITRRTNSKFFMHLFGEGYYVVHYLRWIGYSLSPVVQTGANFGLDVKHDNPFLSSVGSGTVVADGLSMNNVDFSSTSFRVSRASIGRYNFLGNRVAYPSQGKTGDNCLLGTKVMVPIDGQVREGIGLLGSPSFEIPRSVLRDRRFDHLKSEDELRRRVATKKTYDGVTMGLFLLARWLHLFGVVLLTWVGAELHSSSGVWVVALSFVLVLLFSVVYWVFAERALAGFRPMRPQLCSIYEPYFWWHERWWKVPATVDDVLKVFDGTPFKSPLWRLLGARVGRRLFDDGCHISEKMVTIGDDVTLNTGAVIQCHSQEDDTFKSDHITIGAGCTLGVSALVHYGVTMGDGAELAADSFVMKGEEVPQDARWGGNPARELRDDPLPEAATLPPPSWSLTTNGVAARNGVATASGGNA